ncbi:ADR128Cp [Eremothecium gossypii ATCC 10895]|uniref:ADR128Cp n=1 Tax=Eremothecium gossypii (strain ATCC 10895 / CBS 109.51 / FGSC 9923 / NRRL Y-1056) TaxID=284811 RepID=Q759Z5_EREGS|nr:ADR128Cp [Eremothecium gossypii ATCC 10895]AAS52048.1 ADR128Cp [Eremothecium gossypii ATCC 10895]
MKLGKVALVWLAGALHGTAAAGALLGVDYGQQFGKAVVVAPGAPLEIVLTPEAKRKDENGVCVREVMGRVERAYGSAASAAAARQPESALLHTKGLLGRRAAEELGWWRRGHPGVQVADTGRGGVGFAVVGETVSAEETVAMALQQYVRRAEELVAEKRARDKVTQLALTVPEYFAVEQRNALLDAAALVPAEQTYLVSEGLSVAVDFALKGAFEAGRAYHYVVYDAGAGSAKATLVTIAQPAEGPLRVELVGFGHSKAVSGARFTQTIADIIEERFLAAQPALRAAQLEASARSRTKVLQAAERAKLILSVNSEAPVSIESLFEDIDFKTVLHREEVEKRMAPVLDLVCSPIEEALAGQFGPVRVSVDQLDAVILTGGSSRVPSVQDRLAKCVGEALISKSVNADEAAVNGVAIRGAQLSKIFRTRPLEVIDRSIYAYGAKVVGQDAPIEIFPVGSVYPATASVRLPASQDDFTDALELELYEGERLFKKLSVRQTKDKFTQELCPMGVTYNATFGLNANRIPVPVKVEALCWGNPEVVTDQEDTADALPQKVKSVKLDVKETYTYLEPLRNKALTEAKIRLSKWDRAEEEELRKQDLLNSLESLIYSTREWLETPEVLDNGAHDYVEKLTELVSTNLEWLDYESSNATFDDINNRLQEIMSLYKLLSHYLSIDAKVLDLPVFELLRKNVSEAISTFNAFDDTAVAQANELEDNFNSLGLNVTREYTKLKVPKNLQYNSTFAESELAALGKILSELEPILTPDAFDTIDREQLVKLFMKSEGHLNSIEEMQKFRERAHAYRLRELNSLYTRKLRAAKRKEEKSKEAASSSTTDFADEAKATSTQQPADASTSSADSSTSDIDHDEL